MRESVRTSYPTPTSFLKITSLYCSNDLLHNKLVLAVWMKCLQGRGRALPLCLEGNNLNLCLQSNLSRRASRVAAAVHSESEVGLAICGSGVLFAGLVISRWMVPVCSRRLFVYLIIMWTALVFVSSLTVCGWFHSAKCFQVVLFLPFALSKQHWQHCSHPQQASRQNPGWTQKLRSQHRDYLTTGYVVSRRFFTYCASGNYVVCPLSDCCLASFQLQLFPLYLVPSVFPLGVTEKYKDSSCFTSAAGNKLPLWYL